MLARVFSATSLGLETVLIDVEVDIARRSLPAFNIVGLPGKAVEEAKERVRSAVVNTGAELPVHRITVNLSPTDFPKEGPAFDLPIAVGLLIASGQISADVLESIFLGELSLDGTLRSTRGILPATLLAREKKMKRVFVPFVNAHEATVVKNVEVFPVRSLRELFNHLTGRVLIQPVSSNKQFGRLRTNELFDFDLTDIKGQEQAKRALEIAAAGGHNVFMVGSPGSGKTMLARAIPSILPSLSEEEAVEITKIYSITGNLPAGEPLITNRPFRCPHHTVSRIGLIGGGSIPQPGEVSLAHRGVLFLDELSEFPRNVLESLRQPMEDGQVTVSRARGAVTFPARFSLVAASNPCPCGYLGDRFKECSCNPGTVLRYQRRLSGPLMDRVDIHLEVPRVDIDKLEQKSGENSESVRKRVEKARQIQKRRYRGVGIFSNAELSTRHIKTYCVLGDEASGLLRRAAEKLHLSARTYFRIIKIAATIADLADCKQIDAGHMAEAVQYRPNHANDLG